MYHIENLSTSNKGHTLHHNSCFSLNGEWVVFDTRNDDTKIAETGEVGAINLITKEERILYKTSSQSIYGPGVGAASFHPTENIVIFIHGLLDADEEKPYSMSRRFGMLVSLEDPFIGIPADSRDVIPPYSPGSLRGGSHSHCWSPDGEMISFTYNDEFVYPELRTVGVMLTSEDQITVEDLSGNVQGKYYSSIVAQVVSNPVFGSDQISKAFDECWLSGFDKNLNNKNTIAFQGVTKNTEGKNIIEIFLVHIDREKILQDAKAIAQVGEMIKVPEGIIAKRLTYSENGISDFRHWLRSSPDGDYIYSLAKDREGLNQIAQSDVNTGEHKLISSFKFSVTSAINIHPNGRAIVFNANNNVYLFDIESGSIEKLTDFNASDLPLTGAPVFSRDGSIIAFNQFVNIDGNINIQIKIIRDYMTY